MKRFATGILVLLFLAVSFSGCGSKQNAATQTPETESVKPVGTAKPVAPPTSSITAVWGTTVAQKSIAKALAKSNGKNKITLFIYTFPAKEAYPEAAEYGENDFFLEATIKADKGKEITAGNYKGEHLSLMLHTKKSNVIIGTKNSVITISQIGSGKIKGELKLDDGSAKVNGLFDADLF